jgi:hypothetical protein
MPRKATGQLVELKSGFHGRYWATVDGKRERLFVDLDTRNRYEAEKRLARLAEGNAAQLVTDDETFQQVAERVYKERGHMPSAVTDLGFLRTWAFPGIGPMPAHQVMKPDVMTVLEAAAAEGRAVATIAHIRKAFVPVFRQLRREGKIDTLPLPEADELPEGTIDDRPKSVLTDAELLIYLGYTHEYKGDHYRGAVRERQVQALISRCVGGLRTGELHKLTWARACVEDGSFRTLEVIRSKTRRKAAKKGSKAVARQIYQLEGTVLPAFLRYWWLREGKPVADALVFPVRRAKSLEKDRTGEARTKSTWAHALRRDLEKAFKAALKAEVPGVPKEGSQRWRELFEGTADRKPLNFHSSRNAAAVRARQLEVSNASARFTAHATAAMQLHYVQQAGEAEVVPVFPQLCPDGDALLAVLRGWCEAEEIDPAEVFEPGGDDDGPAGGAEEPAPEAHPAAAIERAKRIGNQPVSLTSTPVQERRDALDMPVFQAFGEANPPLGARCRRFESVHPDQESVAEKTRSPRPHGPGRLRATKAAAKAGHGLALRQSPLSHPQQSGARLSGLGAIADRALCRRWRRQ